LAHAVNEANNASQIKTEFLASITHEIRTPMNNVLGMLALLDDTDLSPQQQELQKVAVHSGEALLSLMDDILDFSRISSGQVQLEEVVFNLKRCIDQTLELMGPRAHDKGLELSCVYDGNLPVRVKGDPERLAQLINNLVTNAIKYSAGTDVLLSVQMQRLSETEGELKVTVTDNGKGIDPVLQDRLFDAFSKNSAQNNYAEAGTGLGLAISKGLAECMQGEIGFSSAPEQGASFWFTARLRLSTQQAQKPTELRELMNSHILLVDIDGGLRAALMAELAGWQMDVRFASSQFNPVETLLAAQRAGMPYQLVFINLPIKQKTSLELCQEIRQHAELRNSHLIVLASLAQRADAARMKADIAQGVEWLSKPVTRDKLVRALTQSFNLQEAEGEGLEKLDAALLSGSEGRRILLVEDNAVNQMVARGMLTRLGYLVTSVANGKEALGLLEDKTFDLILMDCLMPVLDGYETTRIWREKEKEKGGHLPIVAMTASVVEGEQQRCLSTGMDDYLSKPVNIDELSAKLRHWLGADKAAAPELEEGVTPRDPQRRTA
ncbi:MAG TPA: response regulator, partial [Candidatus Kapabacteria bacterium]|nr:response regulator [Candidatus Kapabacteria bacterium]